MSSLPLNQPQPAGPPGAGGQASPAGLSPLLPLLPPSPSPGTPGGLGLRPPETGLQGFRGEHWGDPDGGTALAPSPAGGTRPDLIVSKTAPCGHPAVSDSCPELGGAKGSVLAWAEGRADRHGRQSQQSAGQRAHHPGGCVNPCPSLGGQHLPSFRG